MHASDNGNARLITAICQSDISILDDIDHAGRTALMHAVTNGHLEAVTELLKFGPKLEMKDRDKQRSSLFLALSLAHGDLYGQPPASPHWDIANALLDAGAEPETTDKEGFQPLHWFGRIGRHAAVDLLIGCKADVNVNARRAGGWTPLMECIECSDDIDGACLAMELLLDAGANTELHLQGQSHTALGKASLLGRFEQAEILIKRGANVSVMTHSGWSPLHEASLYGHLNIIKLLLEHDAYVNPREWEDRSPIMLACASASSSLECVEQLLKYGGSISTINKDGGTALDEACSRNNVSKVRALLKARADPNRRNLISGKCKGWTSLMRAAEQGHLEACKALVEEGKADVEVKNARGGTAEDLAKGYSRVQEYLAVKKLEKPGQ